MNNPVQKGVTTLPILSRLQIIFDLMYLSNKDGTYHITCVSEVSLKLNTEKKLLSVIDITIVLYDYSYTVKYTDISMYINL